MTNSPGTVFRVAVGLLFMAHGVAHLVGFLVPWQLLRAAEMPYKTTVLAGAFDIGRTGIRLVGVGWLALALGMVGTGSLLLASRLPYGAAQAMVGVSLILSVIGYPDARIGIIMNIVLSALLFLGHRVGWIHA